MDLDDLFGPVELKAENRWEAIDELIDHLASIHKIQPEDRATIAANVRKRESSMSTGVGFGIGLPHASTNLVTEIVAVVGASRTGIQFDALDGKPVNLVILFLVPQGEFQKHVHALADIAKLLHRAEFRDELRRRFLP